MCIRDRYGSGSYQVTQTLGNVDDDWQNWTEVDRYPDPADIAPIFTYGVKLKVQDGTTPPTSGFSFNTDYAVSGGNGNSMQVQVTTLGFNELIVSDPGYGYSIGDNVTISGTGGNTCSLTIIEYEKVLVSADTTHTIEQNQTSCILLMSLLVVLAQNILVVHIII